MPLAGPTRRASWMHSPWLLHKAVYENWAAPAVTVAEGAGSPRPGRARRGRAIRWRQHDRSAGTQHQATESPIPQNRAQVSQPTCRLERHV